MVCTRCKIVVQYELEKLGINYSSIDLGEAEVSETISKDNLDKLTLLGQIGKGAVYDIAWSADGNLLVLGTGIGIYIYDSLTFKLLQLINTEISIRHIDVSPEGSTLITGDNNGVVKLWDVKTGKEKMTLFTGEGRWDVASVKYSPNGQI